MEEKHAGLTLPDDNPGQRSQERDFPAREYRSKQQLLGLPLVHVALGRRVDGVYRRGRAVGWIAVGDLSCGVLLSVGGCACGGIAIGGLAVGVISLAGLAAGGLALGGLALGFMACGGVAVAWYAALGGLAVAHDFAIGGLAVAKQANTEAAKELFTSNPFLSAGRSVMENSRWFLLILLLPVVVAWKNRKSGRQGT